MTGSAFIAREIAARYGFVKRARGCFLYTRSGARLVDLWQEGGRAILGWGGGKPFTALKNALDRGVTGSFPTAFSRRLESAASALLAQKRKVFAFASRQAAIAAALRLSSDGVSFWRPWGAEGVDWSAVDCAIITPPLAWASPLYVLAVRPEAAEGAEGVESDIIPAPLAAAAARAMSDLAAEIPRRGEKDWFSHDKILSKYWTRRGPYLCPKVSKERYADFVRHCLDCAVVASPDYDAPSIVPPGIDKGVFTKLKNSPFE